MGALFSGVISDALSIDALWDRSMANTAPENTPMPMGMTITAERINPRGIVIKETVSQFVWDQGAQAMMLVSAFEGEKDVTQRERRRARRRAERGEDDWPTSHSVFNAEKQDEIALSRRAAAAVIRGRECAVFDFTLQEEWPMPGGSRRTVEVAGAVFVDTESGMPLRVRNHLTDGPDIIEHYSFAMEAAEGPDGRWRVGTAEIEFAGRMIIFIAGRIVMEFHYDQASPAG